MHSIVMPGDIELIYMKNPDFFKSIETQGFEMQVLAACTHEETKIVGTGVRALRKAYINGIPRTVGYLGDLRISPEVRHRKVLYNGYAAMKKLMTDGRAYLHFTTIVEGNRTAKAALTWKNKAGTIPNYVDFGLLKTSFVFPLFKMSCGRKFSVSHAEEKEIDVIADFIDVHAKQRQFHPVYTRESFMNLRDFHINDFVVARYNGKIAGVAALWDQTGFKQLLVKKYNGKMRIMKRLFNRFLPEEGEIIPNACLSFIAVQDDRTDIFRALLSHISNDIRKSRLRYFMVCLHETDPLNEALRFFPRLTYKSRLYLADYDDTESIRARVDGRIPYVEVATL